MLGATGRIANALLGPMARVTVAVVVGLLVCATAPVALGWRSGVIVSGSMHPVLLVGDIAVSAPMPATELAPGQVISVDDPVRSGQTLVHRLVEIDAQRGLVTKGDANESADSTPVPLTRTVGIARLRVPYVGRVMIWARSGEYGRLALTGAALVAIGLLATRRPAGERG